MSNENESIGKEGYQPTNDGYQPSIEKGYQPTEPEPQGGYQPTGTGGDNSTNSTPSAPGDE